MSEVNMNDVDQILLRTVRSDGRIGGLQSVVGEKVHVITHNSRAVVDKENDADE